MARHVVDGEVVDAQSGDGIANASIEFLSDTLDRAETVTDGDGRFTLDVDIDNGVEYGHVTARHPDYETAAAASVYFDGVERVVTIELYRKARE